MAFAVTNEWSEGEVLTAEDLNKNFTDIETDWDVDRITAQATATGFSASSTDSATYVDTNITDDISTVVTSTIFCMVTGSFAHGYDVGSFTIDFQLLINGVASGTVQWTKADKDEDLGVALCGFQAGISSGTITCKLQYKTSGQTLSQRAGGSILIFAVPEE